MYYRVIRDRGQWVMQTGTAVELVGQKIFVYEDRNNITRWSVSGLVNEWKETPELAVETHLKDMERRHAMEVADLLAVIPKK